MVAFVRERRVDCADISRIASDEMHRETCVALFGGRDQRAVVVVMTADGRRVQMPIDLDPVHVGVAGILRSLRIGLEDLLLLITGSRRDRGTRRGERR
ncbi:MAG: hypothetical protein ACJ761_06535 [Chloroflexota bacterium]